MVKLRNLIDEDANLMLEWMRDSRIGDAFRKPMSDMSLEDVKSFISRFKDIDYLNQEQDIHYAIADESNEYLGTISLKKIDYVNKNAEFAIVLRRKAWGTGVAAEATKELLKIAFVDLKLEKVYLNVLHNNVRARNFYEKIGFSFEGTAKRQLMLNKVLVDLDFYGLLKRDYHNGNRIIHRLNKVKMLEFSEHGDERGHLVVVESESDVPFPIARCFYIYGSENDVKRGNHANKKTQFVLINVAGKSKIRVKDGEGNQAVYVLDKPHTGVYLPQMIWKEMYDFSSDSVLLVLASEHYDEKEYVRDYDQFVAMVTNNSSEDT